MLTRNILQMDSEQAHPGSHDSQHLIVGVRDRSVAKTVSWSNICGAIRARIKRAGLGACGSRATHRFSFSRANAGCSF
jgi:hypothetical protein